MKSLKRSMKAGLILMAVGAGLLAYSSDVDSVKAGDTPPLISAILKEDKELYSKEMSRLLNQPMAEFKEAVSFKTKKGDTIFHLMAGVKSHQEFFAQEMRTLSFLADFRPILSGSKKKNLSLGGVNIEIPYLEDTELGKAIDKQDASAVISIAKQLEEMPAIKQFQYIHIKMKEDRWFKHFTFSKEGIKDLSLYFRGQSVEEKIRAHIFPFFYEIKNQKGLLPKHVAESENNLPAYSALADIENLLEDISTKDILMMAGVAVGRGLGTLIGGVLALSVSEGHVGFAFGGLPVGMLTGGLAGGACYELFQKKKLKRMSNNAMKAPAVPRTNPL